MKESMTKITRPDPISPLQGLSHLCDRYPGRCPGLGYDRPFRAWFTAIALVFTLTTVGGNAHADVKPNALFSENAVLQQQMNVPVWGTAAEGEKVTVEI